MNRLLFRDFARYASLNVLGMVSLSCYILADTFFVAQKLGATGLAALNLSIPIYSIIHGLGLMIGIGGATRFSILTSQKRDKDAHRVFSTALRVGWVTGLLFVLIGLFGVSPLARLLGADASTFPMTKTYLATILVFAPFFILNNVFIAFVRNDNKPNLAMLAMLVGSFSNIILDYVFIFPLDMGMFGAAFATSLAPIISLSVLVPHFLKKKQPLDKRNRKIVWKLVPDILSLGSSALIIEVSSAVVLITFNLVILSLEGNLGVAAYGIVANLGLVGVAIFTGLAQGTQPLISRFHGLERPKTARIVRRYALVTSLVVALFMYLGVFAFSEHIVRIFNSEDSMEIARMAEHGLRVYFLGFFFLGINIVAATYMSATERPRDAFFVSMARGIVIIVPMVLILSKVWNMTGVWLAFVFTELTVMIAMVGVRRGRQKTLALSAEKKI